MFAALSVDPYQAWMAWISIVKKIEMLTMQPEGPTLTLHSTHSEPKKAQGMLLQLTPQHARFMARYTKAK